MTSPFTSTPDADEPRQIDPRAGWTAGMIMFCIFLFVSALAIGWAVGIVTMLNCDAQTQDQSYDR